MKKLAHWARRRPRRALVYGSFVAAVVFTVGANWFVVHQARERTFSSLNSVPVGEVALVLGAGPHTLYFNKRIAAAVELFHAGKVRHLIVSGDNHVSWYDEPTAMKEALMARGVPESAITCDYAGFRTLDSVMRAKSVFGLERITVVSQEFHNRRALAVARRHGIDAIAYNAEDVDQSYGRTTRIREVLARNLAVLDLYVWQRQPRFPGPPEPLQLGGPSG